MFDEHVERGVGEILCGASLLQLGEECRKLFCRYPGHFQRIYRQNLFALTTIKRTMMSRIA